MHVVALLSFRPLRTTVQKQFHFISVVEVGNYIDLLTGFPVPVWEDVQDRRFGPLALVKVERVFRKAGQVDNAEVRTDRGPRKRRGLAEVVPAGPDEHA